MNRILNTTYEQNDNHLKKEGLTHLNEYTLLQILVSDFPNETVFDTNTLKFIKYILNDNGIEEYDHKDMLNNTRYYDENMNTVNGHPSEDPMIIDYDISRHASEEIKAYLFYLDTISEIYNSAYEARMDDSGKMFEDEIRIKCRYYVDNGKIKLYTKDDYFEIPLSVERFGSESKITSVKLKTTQENVQNIFSVFETDITHHLSYLYGNDMKVIDRKYFQDIQMFFSLCRLKLMYFIIHSMKLKSIEHDNVEYIEIQENINDYINKHVSTIFVNFKDNLKSEIDSELEYNDGNSETYGMDIVNKSNKLKRINTSLKNHNDTLAKKKKLQSILKQEYSQISVVNIISKIVLVCTLFVAGVIIFYKQNSFSKMFLSLTLFGITLVIYFTILYIYDMMPNIETFENSMDAFAYNMVYDIEMDIKRNMWKHVNEINKSLMIKKMKNEYFKYDEYNTMMGMNIKDANLDLEIKSLQNKAIQANSEYIFQISIAIPFSMMMYNITNDILFSMFILIILFSISTFVYYLSIFKRVRTKAGQYYWSSISSENANRLSPSGVIIL